METPPRLCFVGEYPRPTPAQHTPFSRLTGDNMSQRLPAFLIPPQHVSNHHALQTLEIDSSSARMFRERLKPDIK